MATRKRDTQAAHERLDEAGRYIAKLEKRVKALEGQLDEAFTQIAGFTKLVREQSSSIQKAAQGNYRSLDERLAGMEREVKDLDARKSDRRRQAKKEESQEKAETK